jgi:hypothetical protein
MGAIIKAGLSPEKPLIIRPPTGDYTYHTRNFHPMKLEVFQGLEQTVLNVKQPDEIKVNHGKRKRSNWFILDAHEKKYLKHGESSEDYHSSKRKSATKVIDAASPTETSTPNPSDNTSDGEEEDRKKAHTRKSGSETRLDHHDSEKKQQNEEQLEVEPKPWKERENELCFDALVKHGESSLSLEFINAYEYYSSVLNFIDRTRLDNGFRSCGNTHTYRSEELLL